MSDSSNLESKVQEWLSKQGYPLEMRIASLVRKKTEFAVRQGWHYQDPESGKSREIDIVFTKGEPKGIAEINYVIECKGTNKPWILFTSDDAADSYHRLSSFGIFTKSAHAAVGGEIFNFDDDKTNESKKVPWLWKEGRIGYAVTQAFDGNNDVPYAATLSSIKASIWLKSHSLWQSAKYRDYVVVFPIVVTSSPLFECYLDESGNSVLTPIEHGYLFFNQYIEDFTATCVSIVQEKYFETYLNQCLEVSDYMYKYMGPSLEQDWSEFLREQDNEGA